MYYLNFNNMENDDCLYSAMKNAPIKPPKKKPKQKLEKDIQKEIMKVFESNGYEVIRYNSRSFSPPNTNIVMNCNYNYNSGMIKGHPDVRITKNCISIGVEVKRPLKGFSDSQKKYKENSLKYGNYTVICTSKEQAIDLCEMIEQSFNIHNAIDKYQIKYKQ